MNSWYTHRLMYRHRLVVKYLCLWITYVREDQVLPVFGIFNTWPGILVALDLLVYWGNQSISENVSSSWSTLSMIVWLTNFFQFVQNSVTTYNTLITTLSGVMVQYSVVPEKSCTCWPLIIQSSCALIVPAPWGTAPQDLSLIGHGIEHSLVGSGSSTKLRGWRT